MGMYLSGHHPVIGNCFVIMSVFVVTEENKLSLLALLYGVWTLTSAIGPAFCRWDRFV